MRLDKEKQWVRLSWRGLHTPVEKVLPSSPSARSVTQENRPWPWTLPRRGKEAAQPGPLLPRAGMDVPASGSPGAPLLWSSGCLDGPDGLPAFSSSHSSGEGRVLLPQQVRAACGPFVPRPQGGTCWAGRPTHPKYWSSSPSVSSLCCCSIQR